MPKGKRKIQFNKVELQIGKIRTLLTLEEIKELRDILNENFPEQLNLGHEVWNAPLTSDQTTYTAPAWTVAQPLTGTTDMSGVDIDLKNTTTSGTVQLDDTNTSNNTLTISHTSYADKL